MVFSPERMVALRTERGWSRSEFYRLAVRRGFRRCRSMIDRYELGRAEPPASEAWLIASVLGVPLDALFVSTPATAE